MAAWRARWGAERVAAGTSVAIDGGGWMAIPLVCEFHRLFDSFAAGEEAKRFYFMLDGLEIVIPFPYHIFHWRRWRWEILFGTVIVKHGVVVCEERVLGLDLSG